MRALIFSTAYYPLVGGAEVAVAEITNRLRGIEFVLVTARLRPDLPAEEMIGRVRIYRVGAGSWLDKFRLIWHGPRLAARLGHFDFVWAIMASYGGLAAASYKKRHRETPFLLTLQEGDSRPHIYLRAALVWPWFRGIFKLANHIQAISGYLGNWARRMGASCPVSVVPNAAELHIDKKYAMAETARVVGSTIFRVNYDKDKVDEAVAEVKRKNNLQPEEKLIVTVSRLVKKNGLSDLLAAMSLLPKEYKLSIVGAGKLEKRLRAQAVRLGLSDRVFFQGFVPYEKVWAYYAAADVFVRASLSEGLGNSFLEAMVMHKPVIATPVGGIPDFLEDGVTGWFCEAKNPVSIVEKIKFVLDEKNQAVVSKVVARAAQMVHERFLWDKIALQMQDVFDSLYRLSRDVAPTNIGLPSAS